MNAPSEVPERIYLQAYGDSSPALDAPSFRYEDCSWCWHRIHEHDVEYLLTSSHEAEIARLKEENERVRLANIDCVDWYEQVKEENKLLTQQIATLQVNNEAMRRDAEIFSKAYGLLVAENEQLRTGKQICLHSTYKFQLHGRCCPQCGKVITDFGD